MMNFSELERTLRKTKKLSTEMPMGELLAAIEQLAKSDAVLDAKAKKVLWTLGLGVLCGIASCFLLGWGGFTTWVTGALFVLFIVSLVSYSRKDLSNDLREFIQPVISVLLEDSGPDAIMQLSIDLSDPKSKDKLVEGPPIEAKPMNRALFSAITSTAPTVTDVYYGREWFSGRTQLINGCKVRFMVRDLIRERSKRRRNARGKVKTKVKYKVIRTIKIELGAPKALWSFAPASQSGSFQMSLTSDEKRNFVAVKQSTRFDSLNPDAEPWNFVNVLGFAFDHFVTPANQEVENAPVSN